MPVIAAQPLPVSLFGAPVPAFVQSSAASLQTGSIQTGSMLTRSIETGPAPGASSGVAGAASLAAPATAAAPPAPFADLLTEAVGQVEQYESQAKAAIEGMMTGQGVDVHQAMIATEKAESGFELVLALRNKALAAYQQVVGMQF